MSHEINSAIWLRNGPPLLVLSCHTCGQVIYMQEFMVTGAPQVRPCFGETEPIVQRVKDEHAANVVLWEESKKEVAQPSGK